jgi:hypothetical protein
MVFIKWLLQIARFFSNEPISIQRELINRAAKRRGSWDASLEELLFIYDTLNSATKKLSRKRGSSISDLSTMLRYPKSTLNLMEGKKVPFNDVEHLRNGLSQGQS